jgi:hypothetical protein
MRRFSSTVITASIRQQSLQLWQSQFCITGKLRNGLDIDAVAYQILTDFLGDTLASRTRGTSATATPAKKTRLKVCMTRRKVETPGIVCVTILVLDRYSGKLMILDLMSNCKG